MESELWHRVKSLEQFIKVEWIKCDDENCFEGIDMTSYSDRFPCDKCEGVGKIHRRT